MELAQRPWPSALAGLAALAVAIGIGRFAFTPLLPMMQEDFGLGVTQAGWLASANYAGYFAGAVSAIGMRIRGALAIRAGLVIIGLATLAMGLEQSFVLWLALRFVAGVASAWVLVFVSARALDRLTLLGRPGLSGAVYAGVGAGIAAAGGVCIFALGMHASSADTWLALGMVSIVVTALIWPLLQGEVAQAKAPFAAGAAPGYWRLVLCYGVFGFGYIIPATFLPAMAKQLVPDPRVFGWAWPVFGLAALASTVFAARLNAFVSHRAAWIGGHLVMAAGVVLPLVLPGIAGIMLAALLVGGTFMVVTMAGMQEARSVAGPGARALMAAMTSAFALGQILGPLLVSGLPRSDRGFSAALMLAAALLAFSVLLLSKRRPL